MRDYKVIIEPAEEGGFTAFCPALKGCWSQGETEQEALNNIKDAIEGYIISLKKHGQPIPKDRDEIHTVRIAV